MVNPVTAHAQQEAACTAPGAESPSGSQHFLRVFSCSLTDLHSLGHTLRKHTSMAKIPSPSAQSSTHCGQGHREALWTRKELGEHPSLLAHQHTPGTCHTLDGQLRRKHLTAATVRLPDSSSPTRFCQHSGVSMCTPIRAPPGRRTGSMWVSTPLASP